MSRRSVSAVSPAIEVLPYGEAEWAPALPYGTIEWAWRVTIGQHEIRGATSGVREDAVRAAQQACEVLTGGRATRSWRTVASARWSQLLAAKGTAG